MFQFPLEVFIGRTKTSFLYPVLGTGRKLGVTLQEHRTQVESKTKGDFTRSQRSSTSAEYNKSALTDHALQENHVINWADASVIDKEPDRPLPDGSRRRSTSARKDNEPWTVRRAATNSVMRTTVFLAHLLLTAPRIGRRNKVFILLTKTSGGSWNGKVWKIFGRNWWI